MEYNESVYYKDRNSSWVFCKETIKKESAEKYANKIAKREKCETMILFEDGKYVVMVRKPQTIIKKE